MVRGDETSARIQLAHFDLGVLALVHDVLEAPVVDLEPIPGLRVRGLVLEDRLAIGTEPQRCAGVRDVEHERAAGLEVLAAAAQRGELVLHRLAVREHVEGADHARVAPRHGEVAHVGGEESGAEALACRLGLQAIQHRNGEIDAVCVHAGFEQRDQHAPGAAAEIQHGAVAPTSDLEPEGAIEVERLEQPVVEVGRVVGRGGGGRGGIRSHRAQSFHAVHSISSVSRSSGRPSKPPITS